MSIPETAEKRKKVARTYDIYEDQIAWLDNSSLNKSKKIRELLDNFINERDATVIQNLEEENKSLKKDFGKSIDDYENQIHELMLTIESQKSVIVALGGEQ